MTSHSTSCQSTTRRPREALVVALRLKQSMNYWRVPATAAMHQHSFTLLPSTLPPSSSPPHPRPLSSTPHSLVSLPLCCPVDSRTSAGHDPPRYTSTLHPTPLLRTAFSPYPEASLPNMPHQPSALERPLNIYLRVATRLSKEKEKWMIS